MKKNLFIIDRLIAKMQRNDEQMVFRGTVIFYLKFGMSDVHCNPSCRKIYHS